MMHTNTIHRAARRPTFRSGFLAAAAVVALAVPARAAIEESYVSGETPVTTTWFAARSEPAQRADRHYVAGMRPHHAGALTMSIEYLRNPGRSSPLLQALSRAIVRNQTFEISVLDEVGRNLAAPPLRLPFGVMLQPVATEGLTGTQRFFKEPIPSAIFYASGPVTETDVRFAKAMIIHHEGAVEMARGYLGNRAARNGFLSLMNVDIVTDQTQEIALMRRVIAVYPGDPDAVVVDPSMIHGMEGMAHGGHQGLPGDGGATLPAATVQAGPVTSSAPHAAHDDQPRGTVVSGSRATVPASQPRRALRPRRSVQHPADQGANDHQHHH
jgi:uncharacterized protein (DUF305 family)